MVKENKTTEGYKATDVGVIPEDWEVKSLENIANITMGQSPSSKFYNKSNIGLPLVQGNADIKNRITVIRNCTSQTTKKCNIDDIIMSVRAPVGEVALSIFEACIGRGVCAIAYPNKYLYQYLIFIEPEWAKHSTGSTFDSVNSDTIKNLKIPLPPTRTEQTAIATALSDMDSLIEGLEKLLVKKRNIKQGAMQELLTGRKRLGEFDKGSKYKQTDIGLIPEDWSIVNLPQIGESLIGLTYSPSNVKSYGALVLRSSNIQNGQLSFLDNVFVEMKLPDKVIVKQGDILICVRNGSKRLIGKCALIDKKTEGSAFGAFMSIFRPDISDYVFFQFQSNVIQRQINESLGATINQITNKDLASFKIPLPPSRLEQITIARTLSDMDTEIEKLETQLSKYKMLKTGMMQELLTGKKRLV